MTQPWGPMLMTMLRDRRAFLVEAAARAVANNPEQGPGAFSATELQQMVDGFLAVLDEALAGRAPETRKFYLETVIPGLVSNGTSWPAVVHTVGAWNIELVADVAPRIPLDVRHDAVVWLATFLGAWTADIGRAGSRVLNSPA